MKKLICCLLTVGMVLGLVLAGCAKPAPTPAVTPKPAPVPTPTLAPTPKPPPSPSPTPAMPKVIGFITHAPGTVTNTMTVGFIKGIETVTDYKLRAIPYGSETEKYSALKEGSAHVNQGWTTYLWFASRGLDNFATPEWGPQKVRLLWKVPGGPIALLTRGNSGIRTWADLKGKKVAFDVGNPGNQQIVFGILRFGGLSWNDVVKIPVPSFVAGVKGVLDGTSDAAYSGTTAPLCYELEASPHGIYWFPLPHSDKEGWARLLKEAPWLSTLKGDVGAGLSKEKAIDCAASTVVIEVYDVTSEQFAYEMTKAIHKSYDIYAPVHPTLKPATLENALDVVGPVPMFAPYHPGSVKYFKEIGKWTSAHENWQQKQLTEEAERLAAWSKKK